MSHTDWNQYKATRDAYWRAHDRMTRPAADVDPEMDELGHEFRPAQAAKTVWADDHEKHVALAEKFRKTVEAERAAASFTAPDDAHPASRKFYAVLADAARLHDKKQRDYGTDNDPFANVRASQDFGIEAWLGTVIRMNDKMRRLQTFAKTGTLANEGVEDALIDLLVYAGIALVLFRESNGGE